VLSNVLGVLIAFVSIILLLSIVVTALTQATQAALRVRGRNLLTGVTRLLVTTGKLSETAPRKEKREAAAKVLNAGNIATVDQVSKPEGILRRVILGPRTSWVEARELTEAINTMYPPAKKDAALPVAAAAASPTITITTATATATATGTTETTIKKKKTPPPPRPEDPVFTAIKRAEPAWCKRFQYFMRLVTIGWSLIIAIGFQVSAPSLFASLSQDPARTAKILGEQAEVIRIAKEALAEDEYDLVSDDALDKLATQYPDFADDIAQAGNAAPTKSELVQQLLDVLPDVPERPEMVQAYSKLIDDVVKKEDTAKDPGETAAAAVDQLATFGVTWWQHGKAFYLDDDRSLNFSILIGVLITAILLTFGAPFWFEQLRTLAALRDPRAVAADRKREKEGTKEITVEELKLVRSSTTPARDG
jgi:hypothetical protein